MRALRMILATGALSLALLALAAPAAEAQYASGSDASPGGDFQKVSQLVDLPEFVPGLGVLYVDPGTLPAGPFLGFDRDGNLVNTVFMIPMDEMEDREAFTDLDAADRPVRSVDFRFNAGHPGIPEPHYHVILWHVSSEKAASLQG